MSQESESKRRWSVWRLNLYAIGFACVAVFCMLGYYLFSPTYSAAREAKDLYGRGMFDEALAKAQAIYADNPYNVLAYSVVEQSKKAVRWKRFALDSQGYAERVKAIQTQENIDPADMLLMKMMLETAIADYARLGESETMWDRELVKEANGYYQEFSALYQSLFRGADR